MRWSASPLWPDALQADDIATLADGTHALVELKGGTQQRVTLIGGAVHLILFVEYQNRHVIACTHGLGLSGD